MIGRILSAFAVAALLAGTASRAEPASQPTRADPERRICRMYREVGTRLGGYRACHTAAEWAELRRQTQANIDHIQNSRAGRAE